MAEKTGTTYENVRLITAAQITTLTNMMGAGLADMIRNVEMNLDSEDELAQHLHQGLKLLHLLTGKLSEAAAAIIAADPGTQTFRVDINADTGEQTTTQLDEPIEDQETEEDGTPKPPIFKMKL